MKNLIAAALTLAVAAGSAPCSAQSDSEFAARFAGVRDLVYRRADGQKTRYRRTTQETGPDDPLLLMQSPMIGLVKKVMPSVVLLAVPRQRGQAPMAPGGGICSGFFVDASQTIGKAGIIATNAHCVQQLAPGDEISVGLFDGQSNRPKMTKGRVLAFGDAYGAKDVALVELSDAGLARPGLPLWTKLDVGEQVVAIGNPLEHFFTVTKGVVSALDRDRLGDQFALSLDQIDAAVNPGSSGGPLFNMWGSVVGINSAIFSPGKDGGFIGIAYALPARFVDAALRQYARTGDLKPGTLNMTLGSDGGALKARKIMPGGAAETAGIKEKDQLLSIDGVDLAGMDPAAATTEFIARVKYMSPGEKTTIVVKRGDQGLTITATVGEPKAVPAVRPRFGAPVAPPERED